jgi:hypothetical protein
MSKMLLPAHLAMCDTPSSDVIDRTMANVRNGKSFKHVGFKIKY